MTTPKNIIDDEPAAAWSHQALPATVSEAFKPLVVGAPRSGFALLASVVIHMMPLTTGRWTVHQEVLNALVEGTDGIIAESILREFAARGITDDVVYNRNFRKLTGGPKWLREDDTGLACFRKYIGVRGMGDFTLVTSHPRQVLDSDEVVHSHTDPGLWLRHPGYADYTKFASVRNPVGILNSSVFSINALASEYIQKFVPAERDTDLQRQQLALYKLTDLAFVRGLVQFLVGYLADFVQHWRQYHVMRWEDLILTPVPTIMRLARSAGIPLRADQATRIWSLLDHVNLTGHHRHNYRAGKGIVGNWRQWLVNEHLELFEAMGLEPFMIELGYGSMPRLRESEYTPFQRRVRDALNRGDIIREVEDQDLFTFAFNKSNIVSEAFPFRRHRWRRWTRIERSIFTSEELELAIWDVAEQRTGEVNGLFMEFLTYQDGSIEELLAALDGIEQRYAELFALAPARMQAALAQARHVLHRAATAGVSAGGRSVTVRYQTEPRLIDSIDGHNVVAFHERFYGIPQALGELQVDDTTGSRPEVVTGTTAADVVSQLLARTGSPGVVEAAPASAGPRLTFVDAIPEAIAAACRQHLDEGYRRVLLTPFNGVARTVYQSISAEAASTDARILVRDSEEPVPEGAHLGSVLDADLIVVCETEEPALSNRLLELIDVTVPVVAVKSSCFWAERPLFLISIPKAGTHLLYGLMRAMGYGEAAYLQDDPAPGSWYCVEYSNSHTVARDFFVDSVRRAPFGNRHHPFMGSPAVFIYRNPMDVVASEAHYYHKDGKTAFAGYLSGLTGEERLLRLIDDPWLLGSIRDRMGGFIPWLDLPNVIPVSFEELVGPRGGGSADVQRRAIWSIQLKLHVPGDPDAIAALVFDPDSPTFEGGQIGRYRDAFTDEAYRRYRALPQDFVAHYGYEAANHETIVTVPRRAEEFRHRPLRVSTAAPDAPIVVQYSYLGFNIVCYRNSYFAVRQGIEVDLTLGDLDALRRQGHLADGRTAEEARRGAEMLAIAPLVDARMTAAGPEASIAARPAAHRLETVDEAPAPAPPPRPKPAPILVEQGYRGFNVVAFNDRFYAVSRELGSFDLTTTPLDVFMRQRLVLAALTKDQALLLVDALRASEQLAALAEERTAQVATVDAVRQQVAALEQQLEARTAQADEQTRQLAAQEQRIVDYEGRSSRHLEQLDSLLERLKLEQLERVNLLRQSERLEEAIDTRDARWREAAATYDAALSESRRQAQEHQERVTSLQQAADALSKSHDAETAGLNASLLEVRRQLRERDETLGELQGQLSTRDTLLERSTESTRLLDQTRRSEAAARRNEVRAMEEVGRANASLRQLKQRLIDRETALGDREAEVRRLGEEIGRVEAVGRQAETQARADLERLNGSLAELALRLAAGEATLRDRDAQAAQLTGEIQRLGAALSERDVREATLAEWIDGLQARLAKAEARPSGLRRWLGR